MAKEPTALEQVLIDTIQGATKATGEVYDASKASLSKAIDYAQVQIPDVIHQFLMWHMIQSLVYFILFTITSGFCIFWAMKSYKAKCYDGMSAIGLLTCLSLGLMFANLDWLQILIAPKVYLLEYVTDLIKLNAVRG